MVGAHVSSEHSLIAQAFVAARRHARPLHAYPGTIPQSLEAAYRVQDIAMELRGSPIAGWKVGRIMPPHDAEYGTDRLAGPIFADSVFTADAAIPIVLPVFAEGFAAVEAEFLLRFAAAPDPAKTRYDFDETAALIASIHVGIEIASSPLGAINELGPAVTASDFGNNNGLVVGAEIPNWRATNFAAWPVRLSIDGVEAGSGRGDAMPGGPVGAARFLLELMAERGIALQPGQWISSGAVTGVHRVAPGDRVEARFGDGYAVRCTIEAAAGE